MSLFYRYQNELEPEIDNIKQNLNDSLSIKGGKISDKINMSFNRIRNVPVPFENTDVTKVY